MPLIENPLGGRSVDEWIGKTPDSKVPDRVKERVFLRARGLCHISGRKIQAGEAWEVEHVKPLSLGGEHRERNLAPALCEAHKEKSRAEAKTRAKSNRVRRKHLGLKANKGRPMPGTKASGIRKRMDGTVEYR